MMSSWYLYVGDDPGSVLKKVSIRFDHIWDGGEQKRVEKHGFLGFFHSFLVVSGYRGFKCDFCDNFWILPHFSHNGEHSFTGLNEGDSATF